MMAVLDTIITLIITFMAIAFFSFMYKDNPYFKFAEHTLLGIQMGIVLIATYKSVVTTGVQPLIGGKWVMLFPMILGFLVYTKFSKKTTWVSLLPQSILVGIGIGLSVRGVVTGQFVDQISATILPLAISLSLNQNVNNFLFIVGTVSALSYFIFTREQRGGFGVLTKTGRYFIMVAIGAQFGAMSLIYLSPAITPAILMFSTPGIYLTIIAGIVILVDILRRRGKKTEVQTGQQHSL